MVVVLPPPCRPTIRIGAGGLSIFSVPGSSAPRSTSISASWTILTTCWPGVMDLVTAAPVALPSTALMKSRATGSETSASKSATRTSRKRGFDVVLRQGALFRQPVEDAAKAF